MIWIVFRMFIMHIRIWSALTLFWLIRLLYHLIFVTCGVVMVALERFEIFIPTTMIPVSTLSVLTNLPKEMLSLYRVIYGLKTIPIWCGTIESFLLIPVTALLKSPVNISTIDFIIYVHTASFVAPIGKSYLNNIKHRFGLRDVMSFEMTMYKCVSYFKVLEILSIIFLQKHFSRALVLTGEVAFTPQLRVVPRSTLVGDAATAALFCSDGCNHCLLSVKNKIILGYEKGIYLPDDEMKKFDACFIVEMTKIIFDVLQMAALTLKDNKVILPHNVNIPTWKKIASALSFPLEKIN